MYFLIIFLIPAIAALNNDLENCIKAIKKDQVFWSAVSLTSTKSPEIYPIIPLLNKLKIPSYVIDINSDRVTWKKVSRKQMGYRHIYFVHALNPSDILKSLLATGFWNIRHFVVIFYNLNRTTNASGIFDYFYEKTNVRMVNILLVAVKEPQLSIERVIYKNPFLNRVITRRNCSGAVTDNYFKNLHGHNVKVSYERSTNFSKKLGRRWEFIEGIELRTAIRARNGNVMTQASLDGKGWGGENLPLNGMLGDVSRGVTVMHISPRLLTHQAAKYYQSDLIEYTYPRVSQALVAYIPFHWSEEEFLKLRFYPLPFYLLACFNVLFYLYSKCFKSSRSPADALMVLVAIATSQGVSYRKSRPYGLVFLSVLLMFFCLNIFWLSTLSKYLTVPGRPKLIDTIEEMVYEETFPVSSTEQDKLFLAQAMREDLFLNFSRRLVKASNVSNLIETKTCKNQGFIMLKSIAMHTFKVNYFNNIKCYIILKEDLMPTWNIYAFNFGSPFLPEMNRILSRMSAAGLNEFYWRGDHLDLDLNKKFYEAKFHILGYKFVQAAFNILFWGWALAGAVFIGECVVAKVRKLKLKGIRN